MRIHFWHVVLSFVLMSALLLPGCSPTWEALTSGTDASLRGVSAVDEQVVWVSGSNGTVLRTIDGGSTWQILEVPNASQYDFRDIETFDRDTAIIMGAGMGENSVILRTDDGGQAWELLHVNQYPEGFFNSIEFWNRDRGMIFSDAVDERFLVLITEDGGRTWERVGQDTLPEILPGEHGYAASGRCIAVAGDGLAWFAAGGDSARVFRTADYGETWSVVDVPLLADSPTAGIFGLTFYDETHGVAVGGDYKRREDRYENIAITTDSGQHWRLAKKLPKGLRTAAVYFTKRAMLTVGSHGTDYSLDGGLHWIPISKEGYYAVSNAGKTAWAVGSEGRVGKLTLP